MWVFDAILRGSTEHRLGLQEQNRTSQVGGERVEVLAKECTGAQLPGEGGGTGHSERAAVGMGQGGAYRGITVEWLL